MSDMYNKLFTKILDSSIWLESMPTRLVWVTLIAAMDETGFCAFSAPQNLANRAIVPIEDTLAAITTLEAPDVNSADPDNDGRRIERVPGGWMVLNAGKYRAMVTKMIVKEQTLERVRRHRSKVGNANVQNVTHPSDIDSALASDLSTGGAGGSFDVGLAFEAVWADYPRRLGKKEALRHFRASVKTDDDLAGVRRALQRYKASVAGKEEQFIQHGSRWFGQWRDWLDAGAPPQPEQPAIEAVDHRTFVDRLHAARIPIYKLLDRIGDPDADEAARAKFNALAEQIIQPDTGDRWTRWKTLCAEAGFEPKPEQFGRKGAGA